MASENTTNQTPKTTVKKVGGVNKFFVALVLVFAGATAYFYTQYSNLKQNPAAEAQEEVAKLVAQISKLMVLPEGEDPTVATVTDVEKLVDQPFFAKAENGFKVLIYTGAKKAILFDPSSGKIIEVAPINIGDNNKSTSRPTTTPTTPVVDTSSQTNSEENN